MRGCRILPLRQAKACPIGADAESMLALVGTKRSEVKAKAYASTECRDNADGLRPGPRHPFPGRGVPRPPRRAVARHPSKEGN